MFVEFSDDLVLVNQDTGEKLRFHQRSFAVRLHGVLTHYFNLCSLQAQQMVVEFLSSSSNYHIAIWFAHEEEYHWACLLVHGPQYWLNGHELGLPTGYDQWYLQLSEEYALRENIIELP